MLIQGTKKLLNELGIKQPESPAKVEKKPIFSWHANIITINRKKAVVFVNDKNRYAIVLYGLLAKDMKRIDELFTKAIRETFREECIKDEIIEEYLASSGRTYFTKTRDKKCIARMNFACELVHDFSNYLRSDVMNQSELNVKINNLLVGDGDKDYYYPVEKMFEDLLEFGEPPVVSCRAVEMKVSLELEESEVWRKVVVPLNFTFAKLHRVIQKIFGWYNSHMYEFYIYDGDKLLVTLVCDTEVPGSFEDVERRLDHEAKLWEYIPGYDIKYIYDFGDFWEHNIEVERIIDNYSKKYPLCFDWEGKAPPEDVGGKIGYLEFLEILENKHYVEHEETMEWAEKMGYFDTFDLEEINERLKMI